MYLATIPPPCATHSRTRAPRICMHGENLVNVTGENTVNPVCTTGHKGGVTKGVYMCRLAYREESPSEFRNRRQQVCEVLLLRSSGRRLSWRNDRGSVAAFKLNRSTAATSGLTGSFERVRHFGLA